MGHRAVNDFSLELKRRLDAIREQKLFRELRRVDSAQGPRIKIGGKSFLNFSSNDYLGLANDPALKEAAIKAVEQFGAGSGASRLICGSLAPFHQLEQALADFKRTEAALTFSTGYATSIGTIGALMGKNDVIILDKLVHASIVDAAKLSGAKLRIFAHNDLNDLERILRWSSTFRLSGGTLKRELQPRVLIVTESIFSMDGDAAPLREIVALKEKYGAWLMMDEAHATGIIGQAGRGLAEKLDVSSQIEIKMGTLGKALGASGGYICGSRALIDYLVNRARSFIFSTAPVPAAAAAATAAVHFVQSSKGEMRRNQLKSRMDEFHSSFVIRHSSFHTAIIPILIGDESEAVEATAKLREQGIFVPAIRYPTVARGMARLRVTLTASHSAADVATLVRALEQIAHRKS